METKTKKNLCNKFVQKTSIKYQNKQQKSSKCNLEYLI